MSAKWVGALGGQAHDRCALVGRRRRHLDQPLGLQRLDQRGDVALRHQQRLATARPSSSRRCGRARRARRSAARWWRTARRAGGARASRSPSCTTAAAATAARWRDRRARRHASRGSRRRSCLAPVDDDRLAGDTDCCSGRHSHSTFAATSSGLIRRRCGLKLRELGARIRRRSPGLGVDLRRRVGDQIGVGEAGADRVGGQTACRQIRRRARASARPRRASRRYRRRYRHSP